MKLSGESILPFYLHTDKNLPGEVEEEGRKGRKKRHADEGATMPGGERAASNKGVTKLSGKKGKGRGKKKERKTETFRDRTELNKRKERKSGGKQAGRVEGERNRVESRDEMGRSVAGARRTATSLPSH